MMAQAGRSVTLRLDREVDVSRGDWLVSASANQQPVLVDDLVAQICWFSDQPMRAGDRFLLKMGTRSVRAEVSAIEALIDVESLKPQAVAVELGSVQANDLAKVRFALHEPLPVDRVGAHERLGVGSRFLLIDEASDITVGAGVLRQ
jgi:sulfate adenylyltransferase subunit 1